MFHLCKISRLSALPGRKLGGRSVWKQKAWAWLWSCVVGLQNADSNPIVLSYALNGEPLGVAYEVSRESLQGAPLFPHILTKNVRFQVNFSGEPAFPIADGYTLAGRVPADQRVAGAKRPENRSDCEVSNSFIAFPSPRQFTQRTPQILRMDLECLVLHHPSPSRAEQGIRTLIWVNMTLRSPSLTLLPGQKSQSGLFRISLISMDVQG